MSEATWLTGDVFDRMADIPDGSIDLIVTSPPFLALRSYLPADHPDKHKEIGSEATPATFLSTLLALTREWRRVLAPHGSLCVELGDTYSGAGGYGSPDSPNPAYGAERFNERWTGRTAKRFKKKDDGWPLDKSLCLLPTLYPASLAYGRNLLDPNDRVIDPWRIRNLVVWHRPNPPVGALGDKVRPSTSYVTVACTSRTRWFDLDAERTPHTDPNPDRFIGKQDQRDRARVAAGLSSDNGKSSGGNPAGAPPLDCWFDESDPDVWTITTQPYSGSHYAVMPAALPRKLINLMCPRQVCTTCGEPRRRITAAGTVGERRKGDWLGNRARGTGGDANGGPDATRFVASAPTTLGWSDCGHYNRWRRGIVLDPFAGSGTTLMAASELGRDSIGIDLDHRNLDLARDRLGMFLNEPDEIPA